MTLVQLVTHKKTLMRKHSARGYYGAILGVKNIERYKKGTVTLHHKLDHMSMRLRYYVLLKAMSRAKTTAGKEKRHALEWLRSSKAQKLLTRSYSRVNPNRRSDGDDIGFGVMVKTPRQIIDSVIRRGSNRISLDRAALSYCSSYRVCSTFQRRAAAQQRRR
jgi:hypothetical protein